MRRTAEKGTNTPDCLPEDLMVSRGAGEPHQIRLIGGAITALWTVALALSLIFNMREVYRGTNALAFEGLRISFEKDVLYRRWAADHGGVYVPVTGETPPNPYLRHIPERDIQTPSGRGLTLVNPAYMTRQVNEMAMKQHGTHGHITSLKPLNPGNAPDPWEREALKEFEKGIKEVRAVLDLNGEPSMRLMRPFITEKGCLKCHAHQGYRVGEIRGGISISYPMGPFLSVMRSRWVVLVAGHAVLWLLGLGGVWFAFIRLETSARQRREALGAIQVEKNNFQAIISSSPVGILVLDEEERVIHSNPAAERLFGADSEMAKGRRCGDFIGCVHRIETDEGCGHSSYCGDCPLAGAIREVFISGRGVSDSEIETTLNSGGITRKAWLLFSIDSVLLDGRVCAIVAINDISDRKKMEEELIKRETLLNDVGRMARVGGWELDVETKEVFWTGETYRIHGIPEGEGGLDLSGAVLFFDAPGRSVLETALQQAMEKGEPYDLDLPFTSAKGRHLWTRTMGRAVKIDGKVVRLMGTFQDITERKRAEMKLQEKIDELRKWQEVMRGRETRILEIKREVNELLARLGEPPRYGNVEGGK